MNQISNPRFFVANAVAHSEPEAAAKTQELTPQGVLWLAALGAASRMGVTQDENSRIVQFFSQPGSGRFSQKSFLFYDNFPPKSREILDVVLLFPSDSTIVMAQ